MSSGPLEGGKLQIALNDHHGTSEIARTQSDAESVVPDTGNAREARVTTHAYVTAHAARRAPVEMIQIRRSFSVLKRTAGQAIVLMSAIAATSLQSKAASPAPRKLHRLLATASCSASATKSKAPVSWKVAGQATRSRLDSIIHGQVETAKAAPGPRAGRKAR